MFGLSLPKLVAGHDIGSRRIRRPRRPEAQSHPYKALLADVGSL